MITVQVPEIWLWVFATLLTISAILSAIQVWQSRKLRKLEEALARQGWGGTAP